MGINNRWRVDPFTGTVNELLIEEEEHIIEYHPEPNLYGFYANEGIVLDTGEPVILVEDTTAQTTFTEIPKTIAPNSGQFRVDYDAEGYQNTAFVNCNAGDVGKNILFTYKGTGTIVHPTFRRLTQFNYAGSVAIEQNLEVDGDTVLTGDVILADASASTISASSKIINDVANPVAATDAVNRQTALTLLAANTGFELLTSSGTWVCPENVTSVIYGAIGGGGGGAGSWTGGSEGGPGGQAGGAIFGMQSVTPGGSYAYTIGSGGGAGNPNATFNLNNGSAGGDTVIFSRIAGGGAGGGNTIAGSGDIIGPLGADDSSSVNGGGGGGGSGLLGGAGADGAVGAGTGVGGRPGGLLAGKGGNGSRTTAAGQAGANYGAGGGGGFYNTGTATGYAGGAGAPGCILLLY